MKIGELAQKTGMNASAIRYYEKQGLLTESQRQNNGYRQYNDQSYHQLKLVQLAQNLGFTLDQIRLIVMLEPGSKDQEILKALNKRLDEIELMQTKLDRQKSGIHTLIDKINSNSVPNACSEIPDCFDF